MTRFELNNSSTQTANIETPQATNPRVGARYVDQTLGLAVIDGKRRVVTDYARAVTGLGIALASHTFHRVTRTRPHLHTHTATYGSARSKRAWAAWGEGVGRS